MPAYGNNNPNSSPSPSYFPRQTAENENLREWSPSPPPLNPTNGCLGIVPDDLSDLPMPLFHDDVRRTQPQSPNVVVSVLPVPQTPFGSSASLSELLASFANQRESDRLEHQRLRGAVEMLRDQVRLLTNRVVRLEGGGLPTSGLFEQPIESPSIESASMERLEGGGGLPLSVSFEGSIESPSPASPTGSEEEMAEALDSTQSEGTGTVALATPKQPMLKFDIEYPPDAVSKLLTWIADHRNNPTPSKPQRDALAFETGLTAFQVTRFITQHASALPSPSLQASPTPNRAVGRAGGSAAGMRKLVVRHGGSPSPLRISGPGPASEENDEGDDLAGASTSGTVGSGVGPMRTGSWTRGRKAAGPGV